MLSKPRLSTVSNVDWTNVQVGAFKATASTARHHQSQSQSQNYWPITAIGPVLGCNAAKLQHSSTYQINVKIKFNLVTLSIRFFVIKSECKTHKSTLLTINNTIHRPLADGTVPCAGSATQAPPTDILYIYIDHLLAILIH